MVKTQTCASRSYWSSEGEKLLTWRRAVHPDLSNKYKAVLGSQISGSDYLWYGEWDEKSLPGASLHRVYFESTRNKFISGSHFLKRKHIQWCVCIPSLGVERGRRFLISSVGLPCKLQAKESRSQKLSGHYLRNNSWTCPLASTCM